MRNWFSNLLKNELKVYVARFTNHESNLPCNKTGCCSLRKVVAEVESRTNFCKNICAFYWPKTKFYLIRNSSRNFQQTDLLPHLFGWLFFFHSFYSGTTWTGQKTIWTSGCRQGWGAVTWRADIHVPPRGKSTHVYCYSWRKISLLLRFLVYNE